MKTDALIDTLADNVIPVRRLLPPECRALLWLAMTMVYLIGGGLAIRLLSDTGNNGLDARALIEAGAALMTGMLAAMAAFCAACPGRPVWERALPLPALILWIHLLAEGAFEAWTGTPRQGVMLQADVSRLLEILLLGGLPTVLLLVMLRRGVPIVPVVTGGLAMLSVASLVAAMLRFVHPEDTGVMVLIWNFGPVALLSLLGALVGSRVFPWPRLTLGLVSELSSSRQV